VAFYFYDMNTCCSSAQSHCTLAVWHSFTNRRRRRHRL